MPACFQLCSVGQDGILRTDCQSVQPGAARPNGLLACQKAGEGASQSEMH